MREKQLLQDPGYVEDIENAACSVQNNVKDIRDIKTSHNRILTHFLEFHYCRRC